MIEPTSRDHGRRVIWSRRNGTTLVGRLTGFDGDRVYLRIAGQQHMAPRGQLDWAGSDNDPRALAARSVIEGAGLAIRVVDQHFWEISGWGFWPNLGAYRKPSGALYYGGAAALVAAIRDAGQAPALQKSV